MQPIHNDRLQKDSHALSLPNDVATTVAAAMRAKFPQARLRNPN
jgi:hypothetical protein